MPVTGKSPDFLPRAACHDVGVFVLIAGIEEVALIGRILGKSRPGDLFFEIQVLILRLL